MNGLTVAYIGAVSGIAIVSALMAGFSLSASILYTIAVLLLFEIIYRVAIRVAAMKETVMRGTMLAVFIVTSLFFLKLISRIISEHNIPM